MNASIQRESDKAVQFIDTTDMTTKELKDLEKALDELGKKINDSKLEADTFFERVQIPPEDTGYTVINGEKYTGEKATVRVQFKKGSDKRSEGMLVQMVKVDGAWKVVGNFKKENVESEPVDVKAVKAGGAEGVTSPLRLKDIDTSDK